MEQKYKLERQKEEKIITFARTTQNHVIIYLGMHQKWAKNGALKMSKLVARKKRQQGRKEQPQNQKNKFLPENN